MTQAVRTFEDVEAVRAGTQVLIGLVGPSGGGKTYSALRLASGIQRVTGGDVFCIDTEARRALHYADSFKFRHTEFKAPFGPLDYLAAIEHCVSRGGKIIVVDSASHEHEGPGGVLEMHGTELDRLAGGDYGRRDKFNLLAWQKPKSERRRFINSILQMPVNFIFCFRAKDKTKPGKDGQGKSTMVSLGWMPIAGEEFVYEMTVNMLLYPGSGGVPTWQPEETGEKGMIKLPAQFRGIFEERQPLSEEIGEKLARWAAGGAATAPPIQTAAKPAAKQPRPTSQAGNGSNKTTPDFKEYLERMAKAKEAIGHDNYYRILGKRGMLHANMAKELNEQTAILLEMADCYRTSLQSVERSSQPAVEDGGLSLPNYKTALVKYLNKDAAKVARIMVALGFDEGRQPATDQARELVLDRLASEFFEG